MHDLEQIEPDVSLSTYAAVVTYRSEGISLELSLAHVGIAMDAWPAIESDWMMRLSAEGAALHEAFDSARYAALADIERSLPPLDVDLRAFCIFFQAFSTAPDPLSFLGERSVGEGDLCRLLAMWQARMGADRSVEKDALRILGELSEDTGEVSRELETIAVHPEPPLLRERRPKPITEKQSLAETSLGFIVNRPALPFVPAPPHKPPPLPQSLPPAPPPALPSESLRPQGFGGTSLAFKIDKPILPFEKERAPPEKAPSLLAQTMPAVHLYKPAVPFVAKALAQTAMTFKVDPSELPRPRSGSGSRFGASALAETAPVFQIVKPILPFSGSGGEKKAHMPAFAETRPVVDVPKAALPFLPNSPGDEARPGGENTPPLALRPVPPPSSLGETSLALNVDLSLVLPFAKKADPPRQSSPEASPEVSPRLSIGAYATMCAEIWLDPKSALGIIARYGLSPDTKRIEDASWQARFSTFPAERAAWERLSIEAGARIRSGK